jgi:CRISPR system Cascade subunit CasC
VEKTAETLMSQTERTLEDAVKVSQNLLQLVFGKNMMDKAKPEKTQYLLFFSAKEMESFAEIAGNFWDELVKIEPSKEENEGTEPTESAETPVKKGKKKGTKLAISKELEKAVKTLLNQPPSIDLALFGRMIADKPDSNVDGACQVAHALSTHATPQEVDFFTALDDLKPEDTSGSDMMGVVEFNSACFYRYLTLDWSALQNKLADESSAKKAAEAFLEAAVLAVPTGKQNTFAAHNPPSLALAIVHEGQRFSLANAFEKPVWSKNGIIEKSVQQMGDYLQQIEKEYGRFLVGESACKVFMGIPAEGNHSNFGSRKVNLEQWIQSVVEAL